jgi:Mg/Co/Ni transporter MgtE
MVVRSQSEIDELLQKRDLVALREMLKNRPPSALVPVMTELATEDQMIVLRILPRELAAEAFQSLISQARIVIENHGTGGAGGLAEQRGAR